MSVYRGLVVCTCLSTQLWLIPLIPSLIAGGGSGLRPNDVPASVSEGWRLTFVVRAHCGSTSGYSDRQWALCFVLSYFCAYSCFIVIFCWWGRGPYADRTHCNLELHQNLGRGFNRIKLVYAPPPFFFFFFFFFTAKEFVCCNSLLYVGYCNCV